MDSDVIVVVGCTHRSGFLDEYESQLAQADIPFHVEHIDLPGGANDFTMRRRLAFLRKMATQFIDYNLLIATDAWDVLFFGTKQQLIDKNLTRFLCAAERNCYPEAHLAEKIYGATPWRYANAGMIAGNPRFLRGWCDAVESFGDLDILDQAWFNRRRAEQILFFELDVFTELFYVVSETQEDGSLQMKDGRLWNSHCNTHPQFFHFSGGCPSEGVRQLLEEA